MRKSYSNYIYQLSYEALYFFPIGNFTNHFGFATGKVFSKTASINQFLDCKGKECWFKTKRFGHEVNILL
jgi:hypothetical protein